MLIESVLVLGFMIVIIIIGNIILGIRIEILMLVATTFAILMSRRQGLAWSDIELEISNRMLKSTPVILIIWCIGVVVASFMFSGSIPMVIYYGLKLINPKYMYICAFIVCAILSICTGTSWGSAATGGVAMMGIASGFGISLPITAAAVICGSLVGDKLSPLSETTNLAPLAAGTDLYTHIKSMLWTTIPSSLISATVFFVAGLGIGDTTDSLSNIALEMLNDLGNIYRWNVLVLLPFVVLLGGAIYKKPTVPTMLVSSAVAIIVGGLFQGFDVVSGLNSCISGFTVSTVYADTVSSEITTLLNRGGMTSMVGIVIIVYCGYAFAAVVSRAGYLETFATLLIQKAKTPVSLIMATIFTNFFIAACSGSSYASFIITGEMYRDTYKKYGIDSCVLSRTLEDSGTMMLPLVPWSAAGAFFAATLGVSAYGASGYAVWSANTYLNPLIAILIAYMGVGMYRQCNDLKK